MQPIRDWLFLIGTTFLSIAIVPLLQAPFAKLAERWGWDAFIGEKADGIIAAAAKTAFPMAVLAFIGGLIAMYLYQNIASQKVAFKDARLDLIFDANLEHETALKQDNVAFYRWEHIPSTQVNFDTRQINTGVGYVLVFIAFENPAAINYSRISAIGGGITTQTLSLYPTGAVVRFVGDLRGRSISLRFAKEPIPLN